MTEFRRLDFPALPFLPLHALEVTNAIHQRVFHLRRSSAAGLRAAIGRERDTALARIRTWLERGWLSDTSTDCEPAFSRARALAEVYTERLGCRGFDLLHVAFALDLECEAFLTSDHTQGKVARREGLRVTVSGREK
jgi:hypothetical protein